MSEPRSIQDRCLQDLNRKLEDEYDDTAAPFPEDEVLKVPFSVISANVNGYWAAQNRQLEKGCDVVCLQEANWKTATQPTPKYELVSFDASHASKFSAMSQCIYVHKRLNIASYSTVEIDCDCDCDEEAKKFHKKHIRTIELKLWDGTCLYITNIYNRGAKLPVGCMMSVLEAYPEHRHLIVGDFNLHHVDWSGYRSRKAWKPTLQARELCEQFKKHLRLMNEPGEITWSRAYRGEYRSSTLDLVWISPDAEQEYSCKRHLLENDIGSRPDHLPTIIEMMLPLQPAENEPELRWDLIDSAEFDEVIRDLLNSHPTYDLETEEGREECSRRLIGDIRKFLKRYVERPRRPLPKSRFEIDNPDIREQLRVFKHCRRRFAEELREATRLVDRIRPHSQRTLRDIFRSTHAARKKFEAAEKRLDKLREVEFSRKWRSSFSGSEMSAWRWWKYSKLRDKTRSPPNMPNLKVEAVNSDGQTGTKTVTTSGGKVRALREEWYGSATSPTICCHLCADDHFSPASARLFSMRALMPKELQSAFRRLREYKAAGRDGIGPRCVLKCEKALFPYLSRLFDACLRHSHFPSVFKTGRTVALRKPLKEGKSYSDPGRWRPICLLSTIGKLLESIMAGRIAELARVHDLLPKTQFAARGRSTISALLYMSDIIETSRKRGLAVSIMSLDQKGAFNRVQRRELLRVLDHKGLPQWIIEFVESYLIARKTSVVIPGFESNPVRCGGIPQGSPMSPILFAFFTVGLLEDAADAIPYKHGLVFKLAYSDDTYIIAVSQSLDTNKRILKNEFDQANRWATRSGATFGLEKTELLHFACPTLRGCAEPISSYIRGIPDKAETSQLPILGVIFEAGSDGGLSWNAHFKYAKTKYKSNMARFSRIVQMTHGIDLERSMSIYNVGPRSSITYASPVWYEPEEDPRHGVATWIDDRVDQDDEVELDEDPEYTPNGRRPVSSRTQVRLREGYESFQNRFLHKTAGAMPLTHSLATGNEVSAESLNLTMRRQYILTRAKMMGTEVWQTILHARRTINDLGRAQQMSLRSKGDEPMSVWEKIAKDWRDQAAEEVRSSYRLKRSRVHTVVPHDWDGEQAEDILQPGGEEFSKKLNKRLNEIAFQDSLAITRSIWDSFRNKKIRELEARNRPVPVSLRTPTSRDNIKRYKGMDRPESSLAFQLRTGCNGLAQHRARYDDLVDPKRCGKCGQRCYENAEHLFESCPGIHNGERKILVQDAWKGMPPNHVTWSQVLQQDLALSSRFAMKFFPFKAFDWTRRHMLDDLRLQAKV